MWSITLHKCCGLQLAVTSSLKIITFMLIHMLSSWLLARHYLSRVCYTMQHDICVLLFWSIASWLLAVTCAYCIEMSKNVACALFLEPYFANSKWNVAYVSSDMLPVLFYLRFKTVQTNSVCTRVPLAICFWWLTLVLAFSTVIWHWNIPCTCMPEL